MEFTALNGTDDTSTAYFAGRSGNSRLTLSSGVLSINGTHRHDRWLVEQPNSGTVRVTYIGKETRDFDISSVSRIRVTARKGNDRFENETSIPTDFFGMEGNDIAFGSNAADNLYGGVGNDQLYGGGGDDNILGEDGNDRLDGGDDDDWVAGGLGDDRVIGNLGNDRVTGDAGDDNVTGDEGNDYVWGWLGDDYLRGGEGIDRVFGQQGNDRIDGGSDRDWVYGGSGDDLLEGGLGTDNLYGENGNDTLSDRSGLTRMYGGRGDDILKGSPDVNYLHGDSGNDILEGGRYRDFIYGGNGADTLLGGSDNRNDYLSGGWGVDRILYHPNNIVDRSPGDINIQFVRGDLNWTADEILVLDRGIKKMYEVTGNNKLFVDAITGEDLTFQKYRSLPGGAAAINRMTYETVNGKTTYDRVIQFANWDESIEAYNDQRVIALHHEIAHNFDNDFEFHAAGLPFSDWQRFAFRSRWRTTNPNSSAYARSTDRQWWYLRDSEFYRSYSRVNAYEDWATSWEMYFSETTTAPPADTNLGQKYRDVIRFMNRLRS